VFVLLNAFLQRMPRLFVIFLWFSIARQPLFVLPALKAFVVFKPEGERFATPSMPDADVRRWRGSVPAARGSPVASIYFFILATTPSVLCVAPATVPRQAAVAGRLAPVQAAPVVVRRRYVPAVPLPGFFCLVGRGLQFTAANQPVQLRLRPALPV
jgi:hypothetical protein